MHNPPPARLIDVTRLLRRSGRMLTGVDRVELAYLQELLQGDVALWGMARTPLGYVLLDRTGLAQFAAAVTGARPFGPPDLLSRLSRRQHPTVRAAQSDLRRWAVARCMPRGLARMLVRHLPEGTAYLNLGHSNLTERVFEAVRAVAQARITVFIHDIIPLTHPQFQRPGTVAPFEAKLARVQRYADLILYNSDDTRRQTEAWMQQRGTVPAGIVAHLGTIVVEPDPSALPARLRFDRPYFVCVGTIEPRKNHALLLDIWEALGDRAPPLVIAGSRGWNNAGVFARLDALPEGAPVHEAAGLSDAALAALVQGAHALLFPSHAEGFGLPAIEAMTLGTPVLCSNIATFGEILGDKAVYTDPLDWQLWQSRVVDWSKRSRETLRVTDFDAPTWDAHFKIALSFT
ncbi:glycosyltransferase family 4 protein [Sulfitobacter albidus]|uniref:Glycosyltransferase family 4 protein n=1 Tax=Sulfitobacter albidus TaxID=2829501 RepID=A0A975JCX9_9RHOB|nr:glycosyltransferase family 1 protein [Sulfitobacter albidus]QUJ76138.1 glycosyltransferase family 4 protein [Sulfitobacter albidus]